MKGTGASRIWKSEIRSTKFKLKIQDRTEMHKTIGLIGGMSPESTVEYYRYIVHEYTRRFNSHNYPPIIIYSVSFEPYIRWPAEGRWDLIAEGLSDAAKRLEAGGADCILIATNTMHIVFEEVRSAVKAPMINLLDSVAEEILRRGINKVGLLGTNTLWRWRIFIRHLSAQKVSKL